MKEQQLAKPSEILLKMLEDYAETQNNSSERVQLSNTVFVERLDENHVLVTNMEEMEEQDTEDVEIVFCESQKLPKSEVFEINESDEHELRRIKNTILLRYLF